MGHFHWPAIAYSWITFKSIIPNCILNYIDLWDVTFLAVACDICYLFLWLDAMENRFTCIYMLPTPMIGCSQEQIYMWYMLIIHMIGYSENRFTSDIRYLFLWLDALKNRFTWDIHYPFLWLVALENKLTCDICYLFLWLDALENKLTCDIS